MESSRRGVVLLAVVLVISAIVGGLYGPSVRATSTSTPAGDMQQTVHDFSRVLAIVQQNYAEPVDADKAIYSGAIPGMLHSLDPHSFFFDPNQYGAATRGRTREILRRGDDGCLARKLHRGGGAVPGVARI